MFLYAVIRCMLDEVVDCIRCRLWGGERPPTAPAEAPRPRQAKIMGPWGLAFFYKNAGLIKSFMYQTGCFCFVRQPAESVRTMFPVPQF